MRLQNVQSGKEITGLGQTTEAELLRKALVSQNGLNERAWRRLSRRDTEGFVVLRTERIIMEAC